MFVVVSTTFIMIFPGVLRGLGVLGVNNFRNYRFYELGILGSLVGLY
jgi:hypothetical protein